MSAAALSQLNQTRTHAIDTGSNAEHVEHSFRQRLRLLGAMQSAMRVLAALALASTAWGALNTLPSVTFSVVLFAPAKQAGQPGINQMITSFAAEGA
jgi:hypothetical protein